MKWQGDIMLHRTTMISAVVLMQSLCLAGAAKAEGDRPFAFSGTLGASFQPTYEGSENSETRGLIDFNVSFGDGRFFAGTRGIGYTAVMTEEMTLRVALGYGGGRDEDDDADLAGLGDIDAEALAVLSGEYRLGQVSFGADILAGQDYGATADLKVSTGFQVSDRVTIGAEASATYADNSHMQRYFGVTATQSAASGKAAYSAGSGIKSAGVGVLVSFAVTEATSIDFGARYARLMGDAGDSPITKDKAQPSAFLGVSTRF
jgi:MipA family protein